MSTDTTPAQAFADALAAFQSELPHIGKGQTADTGSYSYDYADLTAISEAALPLLARLGLSFSAKPTMIDGAFLLHYTLRHVAGHEDAGYYPLPDPVRSSPQQIGSAITYGRRYCLCAVTGIAPGGEDDDGAKANDARSADLRRRKDGHIDQRAFYGGGKKAQRGPADDDMWQGPVPVESMDAAQLRTEIGQWAKANGKDLADVEAEFFAAMDANIRSADEALLRVFVEHNCRQAVSA